MALGDYYKSGFEIYCPDDHVILVVHEGEYIAVFSQTGARPETIQKECAGHLVLHDELGKDTSALKLFNAVTES